MWKKERDRPKNEMNEILVVMYRRKGMRTRRGTRRTLLMERERKQFVGKKENLKMVNYDEAYD